MGKHSEIGYWEGRSRARKSRKPTLNALDLEAQARAAAEIMALAKVFTRMVIPDNADEIAELPAELVSPLLKRSSLRSTQDE